MSNMSENISNNSHIEWLTELTNGASGRSIATKAGLSVSTVNKQIKSGHLSAENVMAIARAWGQSPQKALIRTGFLAISEAQAFDAEDVASVLPSSTLLREIARRMGATDSAAEGL